MCTRRVALLLSQRDIAFMRKWQVPYELYLKVSYPQCRQAACGAVDKLGLGALECLGLVPVCQPFAQLD